jgi:hypothetical protein
MITQRIPVELCSAGIFIIKFYVIDFSQKYSIMKLIAHYKKRKHEK